MNIDTSSSAISSTSSTSTSSIKSNSRTTKTDSSSFEDEIKSVSTQKEEQTQKTEDADAAETEKTENAETEKTEETQESKDENSADDNKNKDKNSTTETLKGNAEVNEYQYDEKQSILSRNIQSLIDTGNKINFSNTDFSNLQASIDYQSVSMSDSDAMFFTNLVQNTDMSMQSIASNLQQLSQVNVQAAEKTAKVSATMMNLLSDSMKTNQPFRIDFDKDVSVIIKVNKDGSIMANFIPGDKAVEEYLKNNIGFLRQRFDDQNLAYSQLSYSKHKQQQEQQNRNNNDKENADE